MSSVNKITTVKLAIKSKQFLQKDKVWLLKSYQPIRDRKEENCTSTDHFKHFHRWRII